MTLYEASDLLNLLKMDKMSHDLAALWGEDALVWQWTWKNGDESEEKYHTGSHSGFSDP